VRDSTNRLLDFLSAPAKPAGDACRSNPRRESSSKVELSWHDGQTWRTTSGRLSDISKGGAGLVARSEPTVGGLARLRIVDGEGSPWIEATILAVESESSGRSRIRIGFPEPCPSFFLGLAVLGAEDGEPEPTHCRGWKEWAPVA
jgi:hypothetical protein